MGASSSQTTSQTVTPIPPVSSGTNLDLMDDLFANPSEPNTMDLLSGLNDLKPTPVNSESNVNTNVGTGPQSNGGAGFDLFGDMTGAGTNSASVDNVSKTFGGFDPFKNASSGAGNNAKKPDVLLGTFAGSQTGGGSQNNLTSPNKSDDLMSGWNKGPTQPMMKTASSPGFGGSASNITARGSAAPQKADPFADFGSFGKPAQPMNATKMSGNTGKPMGSMGGGMSGGGTSGMGGAANVTSPLGNSAQGSNWQNSPQHQQGKPNYSGGSKYTLIYIAI